MFNFFEELFAPGRKHTSDERKRLALSRVDLGVGDPHRGPIDLSSGKVTVRAPARDDAAGRDAAPAGGTRPARETGPAGDAGPFRDGPGPGRPAGAPAREGAPERRDGGREDPGA
ncbi:DUF6191 domain-containing protein [Streptomyces sp. NPDC015501]|uniref:DUF6191 domain-containing protein n=1 Tax=unclassified Streptomyces TaxID=2593676 RepID=UPI0011A1AE7D|nr:hypothetical protein A3L22_13480 [Streptomyces griseus subsp. griseus]